ncbi:hypothetical protein JTB14_005532, partial [Gonioctena quinquepunctata]
CEGVEIPRKQNIMYLGITLREGSYFREHIKPASQKAGEKIAALSRIMPNISGPGSKKREMLLRVTRAYRTVSAKALQVTSGKVPTELLAGETLQKIR